jgi:uncharacterized protein
MIISFEIENWMAFKEDTLFTMIASKERQHKERVVRISKYPLRILPVTSIYGGNASGKTIFFKALRFAKDFIVNGLKAGEKIPVEPFRLDPDYKGRPTNFRFELLIDELIYEYSFALKNDAVIEEKLVKITSSSETELYYRKNGDLPGLNKSLPERERLRFAFDGTDSNQLFLTNSISQKLTAFKPVSDWFENKLVLIGPQTHSGPFTSYVSNKGPSYKNINKSLQDLDTGILYLDGETITLESLQLNELLREQIKRSVTDNIAIELTSPGRAERIMIYKKNDDLVAKKLVSYHRQANGGKVKFEIADESDGTRRLIELLPGFHGMSSKNNDKVYVIDELDRSLHTMLTRQLINSYLCSCNGETRSQLIFTTHDLLLMDQELLRRDEMWITEKDYEGAATLISFAEYKDIRSDKDIRKSYLQGRFGGVPKILIDDCLIMNDSEG